MPILEKNNLRLPKLDGVRFLAFSLVFFHHYIPHPNFLFFEKLHDRGWIGVELFFILSSFLLTRLLIHELKNHGSISIKNFFARRILRIWPAYFSYIFLIIIFSWALSSIKAPEAYRLIGLFTFTDNFFASLLGYNEFALYLAHLWTISLEEQYYLLLPFLVIILAKSPPKKIAKFSCLIITGFIVARILAVLFGLNHPFIWVLPIQADAFVFGTLYGLGVFNSTLSKINNHLKIIAGALIIISCTFLPNINETGIGQIAPYTFLSIAFLIIVDGVLNTSHKIYSYIFNNTLIKYLGKITYGLYLYHFLGIYVGLKIMAVLKISLPLTASQFWLYGLSISFLVTLFIAAISYATLEAPILKLKNKFYKASSNSI